MSASDDHNDASDDAETGEGSGPEEGDVAAAEATNEEADDSRIRPETDPAAELEDRPKGEERVGEVLSRRYRLTEFLGRGAMGEVFRAEHALMKKTVAIKILHSDVSGHAKIVERFRREAQAAANIDHPNVCVATDFGRTAEKDFFLVMEFLEGPTLKEMVREEGPLSVERSLYIANQICSALVRAHEVGVIHRDLKPDNIMLIDRGEDSNFVKILDFGIARVRMDDETPELTKTGAVFGTPSYMSPEQAAGDPVDHRTDIYAIGSLLFEMLTARRVFEGERGAEVMAKHVSQDPPAPSEYVDHQTIPQPLEDLILEMLEKNPDDRPQTAVELQKRLLEVSDTGRSGVFPGIVPDLTADDTDPVAREAQSGRASDGRGLLPRTLDSVAEWMDERGLLARWAAFAAVVLGVGAAAAGGGMLMANDWSKPAASPRSGDESLAAERRDLRGDDAVEAALRHFDRGALQSGIDALRRLEGPRYRKNPHVAFWIGRGFAEQGRWDRALGKFERVVELEPSYVTERVFLDYLVRALEVADPEVAEQVRGILKPQVDRRIVRETLAREAWRASAPRIRERTYELLRETGMLEGLPEWIRASIALRRARGCKEHREQIDALVELGDPRTLGILRIYRGYPDSVIGCVRDEINEAIRTLEGIDDRDG